MSHRLQSTSAWKSVEIDDIMPLLLLIAIALFISYLVYIIEYIIYKNCFKRVKFKKIDKRPVEKQSKNTTIDRHPIKKQSQSINHNRNRNKKK